MLRFALSFASSYDRHAELHMWPNVTSCVVVCRRQRVSMETIGRYLIWFAYRFRGIPFRDIFWAKRIAQINAVLTFGGPRSNQIFRALYFPQGRVWFLILIGFYIFFFLVGPGPFKIGLRGPGAGGHTFFHTLWEVSSAYNSDNSFFFFFLFRNRRK